MRGDYEIGVTFKEDYTVDGVTRSCEVETCFFASVVLNMDSIKVTRVLQNSFNTLILIFQTGKLK